MNPSLHETESPAPSRWKTFLHRWAVQTVSVMVAAGLVSGIRYQGFEHLLVASLLLGVAHAFVRPALMLISLPLVILSFGLFVFVINAGLLLAVSYLLKPRFEVSGFSAAFWGGLVISFTSMVLSALTGLKSSAIRVSGRDTRADHRKPGPPPPGPGAGPIIDV